MMTHWLGYDYLRPPVSTSRRSCFRLPAGSPRYSPPSARTPPASHSRPRANRLLTLYLGVRRMFDQLDQHVRRQESRPRRSCQSVQ